MLKFRNTLSGQLEEFQPLEARLVRLYSCGPTVYDYAHIGNFRTFVFVDLLRRYLHYRGFELCHVMNITDVDDKTIKRSTEEGVSLREYTEKYTQEFLKDMADLNIEQPEIIPRATDHIPEMITIIDQLRERGHTYTSEGSVYYSVASFKDYGKLSKINLEGNIAGARVDVDTYEKGDARDFALWKAAKEGETSWDTPYGSGRPGWHLECSAMSMKYLGETFDIHCGGVDLVFPHHENEIAQSEGATGQPFVRYWLHAEHLMVEGQRMGKSLGNYYTFRDLVAKGIKPMAIRYLLLSVPYRKQLNFTFDGLKAAEAALERLQNFRRRIQQSQGEAGTIMAVTELIERARQRFEAGLDDDLNTSVALAAIFDLLHEINPVIDQGALRAADREALLAFLASVDTVFGVLGSEREEILEEEILRLIEERNQARRNRNFARADELRQVLSDRGILLEDTKEGVRWRRK